jgi:3-oxoacyl-[acyl-carrier protein] reductase
MFGIVAPMSADGDGDVVLITGGARGIGLSTGRFLGRDGWRVVLTDRDADAVEGAAGQLQREGLDVTPQAMDVTQTAAVDAGVEAAIATYGRLDAVVNNAGVLRDRPLTDMTDADFWLVVDVSLAGAFRLSRAAARHMIRSGYGRIVNVASRAYLGNPGQANYSAAKAGLVGLTKALAKELGRHEITVNAVAPGMVETELVRSHPHYDAIVERAVKANSVPRIGRPEDVAGAIGYLCSRSAGYVTGDVLHVTGGRFG